MPNFGLYKAFDEQGIDYAKTAVGDKYVYEYMAKNGCRIGGEQSGHIIFSKYASTGDGILTSLKMMEVMLAKKLTETSTSQAMLSVYTNTICVAKRLLGNTQTRELDPVDAGCTIASLDRIEPVTLNHRLRRP